MDDWFNNWVALGLFIWQLVIYCPQYYKIVRQRSSLGHHSLFMFLGHTASFLAWINALIYYIHPLRRCRSDNLGCLASIYGLGFYFLQWFLYLIWYLLFLFFLEPDEEDEDTVSQESSFFNQYLLSDNTVDYGTINPPERPRPRPRWHQSRLWVYRGFFISVMFGVVAFITTVTMINREKVDDHQIQMSNFIKLVLPGPLMNWSFVLEIIVMIGLSLHYLPQIYEFSRLGRIGSYSLISLALMIPGNVLWTIFLSRWSYLAKHHPIDMNTTAVGEVAAEVISDNSYNFIQVWIPYLIMTVSQGVTLFIGMYWRNNLREYIENGG